MDLTEFRTNLRTLLSDTATYYADGEIDLSVEQCIYLMSRVMPRVQGVETTVDRKVSGETLSISSDTGTTAKKPIEPKTETIVDGSGNTKTRDTDYTINYFTGQVDEIGSNLPDANYTIDYDLDWQMLDISSLLPTEDILNVESVELPVGNDPPTHVSFRIIDDYLLIYGEDMLRDGYHIRIIHWGAWTPPTAASEGNYPSHLDYVILVGAQGLLKLIKAEKYMQEAITQLSSADTDLDAMDTPLGDINAALDKVDTYLNTSTTPSAKKYLEDGDANIDTSAHITGATAPSIKKYLEQGDDKISDMDTSYLTGGSAPAAHYYLDTGDAEINAATVGENVGRVYGEYARWCIEIARAIGQQATLYNQYAGRSHEIAIALDRMMGRYSDFAKNCIRIADGFLGEASQRVNEARAHMDKSVQEQNLARSYLEAADRYLNQGQTKMSEFYQLIGQKAELQTFQTASLQSVHYSVSSETGRVPTTM